MSSISPFGEHSLTLVAASFDARDNAEHAAVTLEEDCHLEGTVKVIAPGDPSFVNKLEPEQRGIWRTLVRSHVILGILGAVLGAAVAMALIASWPAATSSPGFTVLFSVVFGVVMGLMMAGALTLRPDHGFVIDRVRGWLKRGRWVVVVRPASGACASIAVHLLEGEGAKPVRSF